MALRVSVYCINITLCCVFQEQDEEGDDDDDDDDDPKVDSLASVFVCVAVINRLWECV